MNSGGMKHAVIMNREAGMESIIEEDEQPQPSAIKDKSVSNTNFGSNISLSKRKQQNKFAKFHEIQKPRALLSQQVLANSPGTLQ